MAHACGVHARLRLATGPQVRTHGTAVRHKQLAVADLMAGDALVVSCHSETEYQSWALAELLPDPFKLS